MCFSYCLLAAMLLGEHKYIAIQRVLFSCSGITEEELCAAGVSNPSHRRRILENLPKIWD